MGDPAAGLTAYGTYCAGCHGANPANNQLKVAGATTVPALDSAIAQVGSMGWLSSLTTQQKLDITSYIASVVK
ncbi:hypothetical protein [uncultured Piscinibacter sp.]|uniref:hypothetical protein n=1 Tax=uncultured Piscinibacter sp. TaxID=1131835 RepID=UPI002604EDBD|nr:hypothetical protein [uncultured Piscinibacter sp.]